MSWADRVLSNLSAHGHRVTGPRRAILEQITHYRQPFSAEQLFKDLGGEGGPIGRATIYRTVDLLLEDGWLSRVHWSASKKTTVSSDHAYVAAEQGQQ
ncbi:MAG TPA: transcriptional repressor, partial [Roseiflexaceae bacterium]|nr:transcriptional repressor [Roseiflexaceae bacterium]